MEDITIKEVKEEANLFLFQTPGIGLKELELSNKIFEALENYQKEASIEKP